MLQSEAVTVVPVVAVTLRAAGDVERNEVVAADELGVLLDGDQLMAALATEMQRQGKLKGNGVVATQMSNLGLERYLNGLGLQLIRTRVGDRYVT